MKRRTAIQKKEATSFDDSATAGGVGVGVELVDVVGASEAVDGAEVGAVDGAWVGVGANPQVESVDSQPVVVNPSQS